MVTAIITVGLAGAGKSTHTTELAKKSGAIRICADEIRQELLGDANDMSQNEFIWATVFDRVAQALRDGQGVIVDGINTNAYHRGRLVKHCRLQPEVEVEVVALWFTAGLETCLEQNASRDRRVPLSEIKAMDVALRSHPPILRQTANPEDEGFDRIEVVKHVFDPSKRR